VPLTESHHALTASQGVWRAVSHRARRRPRRVEHRGPLFLPISGTHAARASPG